jgi:predicted AAA+ superfamily ATPase
MTAADFHVNPQVMFVRALTLPAPGAATFFLWGPRQVGKTTLLRAHYPDALWFDLLKTEEYRRFLQHPEELRELVGERRFVVIDEIQKLPALLDEVHWLHENRRARFALCGSSARKVRRGHANLLGGRALRYELLGLTAHEVGERRLVATMVNDGTLPEVLGSPVAWERLTSYVADYLREEVAAEALVRRLPAFADFLEAAALADGEQVSYATIARECGVSANTVKGYFEVLVDTLLGRWLPAYRRRPKRRTVASSKFYFHDVGVVNVLARRRALERGSALYGKAFENLVHHELVAFNAYARSDARLSYWRLTTGVEVDFIVDDVRVAIECKASDRVRDDHLRGLRELKREHPKLGRRIVVSHDPRPRRTHDGIEILPFDEFVGRLWSRELWS